MQAADLNAGAPHNNIANSGGGSSSTQHQRPHRLERLDSEPQDQEEEEEIRDSFCRLCGMAPNSTGQDSPSSVNDRQINGGRGAPQHEMMMTTNKESCLDSLLNRVSATLGAEPFPARYNPVSTRHDGNHHENNNHVASQQQPQQWSRQTEGGGSIGPGAAKRSRSDPPLRAVTHQHYSSGGVRRRPSIRRKTELIVREHVDNGKRRPAHAQPSSSSSSTPYDPRDGDKPPEGRQSFELKQNAIHSMQTDGTLEHLSALENSRVEERYNSRQNFWRRLAVRASGPDVSQKELVHRSTFLVVSSMTVGAGVLWGMMYVAVGERLAALMPFAYSVVMGLVLFTCICNSGRGTAAGGGGGGGYDTFVGCQLALILLLPFAVHVALGGVERSGGVMLWSFLCPMGAAFFRSADESARWFKAYMIISGALLVKEFWDLEDGDESMSIDESAHAEGAIAVLDVASSSSSSSSAETIQKLFFLMNILGVKCVIFAAVFLFARELEKEYTKSEEVLANILPSAIVKRIKRGEFPIVDHVANVSVLFADLVGFTKASTELHPNFLIGLFLRDIFSAFDELVYRHHGLEKIKTIGDAYMVVGGLRHGDEPSSHSRAHAAAYGGQAPHATNTMMLAADMFRALGRVNRKYNLRFDLRIGVHTGPVVAGVLGLKRFAYDVWGDSVNVSDALMPRVTCFILE